MRNLRPQDERSARQWRCDAATGEGGDRAGKGAGGKGFDEFRVVGHVGWILLDNSPSLGHLGNSCTVVLRVIVKDVLLLIPCIPFYEFVVLQ